MSCEGEHCITCGDIATEMTVVELDAEGALALCVDDDGASETVDVALLAPVALSDRVLVHAGTAIARSTLSQPAQSSQLASGHP